ncbi:MAG: hypothetical protein ABIP99_03395 [Ilumatobacteraceae bacterium]
MISINVADSWIVRFDKGRTYVDPDDPYYASLIADGYQRFFDATVAAGVRRVVWLDPPPVPVMDTHTGALEDLASAARRRTLIDKAVAAAVAAHPGRVQVLPYGAWLEGSRARGCSTMSPTDRMVCICPTAQLGLPSMTTSVRRSSTSFEVTRTRVELRASAEPSYAGRR